MWPQLEQTRSTCLSAQLKVGDEIQDNRDPNNWILARMRYAAAIGGNGAGVGAKGTSLTFQECLRVHYYILTDESRKGMIHDLVHSDRESSVSPAPNSVFLTSHCRSGRTEKGQREVPGMSQLKYQVHLISLHAVRQGNQQLVLKLKKTAGL